MKNITITEIRAHLKTKGQELTKLKMKLNGNDAYEVKRRDGGFNVYTVHQLKEAYQLGDI